MNEASVLAGVFLILLVLLTKNEYVTPPVSASEDWQSRYIQTAKATLPAYQEYVSNTYYADLTDPQIQSIAADLLADTESAKDAMQAALSYVHSHVAYTREEDDPTCISRTATDILDAGTGQCDTQSEVVIALLRAMGVAATPVGGCIYPSPTCTTQALFELPHPLYEPLSILPTPLPSYSRRAAGGLHAWVAAWDDTTKEWVNLEATSGTPAQTSCWTYHVEMYPDTQEDICKSTNYAYVQACNNQDLAGLNREGLGLATEVTP